MPARRKGKFISAIHNHDINEVRRLLCTRQIPVNAGASNRDPFIIECFKVNYRQVRIICTKEDEPNILEMLKLLVQHGANLNVRGLRCSPRGMTAAMIAADQGLERCLRFLVESGADLTITADSGDNTLMMAARAGQVDCVKYLTEHSESGSFLNQVNKEGDNALMMAARAGQVDCVKYLIEHSVSGSLLNQVNKEGQTALMMAASRSDDDHALYMKFFVEAGADVNVHDSSGLTALMYALEEGHTESVKFLTEQMSVPALNQVNNDGKTALMMAASGYTDEYVLSVKSLVEAGADVNLHDRSGLTALMYALEEGYAESVEFLTEQMSVPALNQVNNDGKTALMMAASGYTDEYVLSVKSLVEAGADVNLHDRSGFTALMYALEEGHTESVEFLTEQMSVPALNQVNNDGKTALMMAASGYTNEYDFIVKSLEEAEADVNLHNTSEVQSLIKGGADLSLQDNIGRNALMIAIERNQSIAILKLLTENMSLSNINQVNEKGQTALMLAASNYDPKNAICLLIEAGADLNVTDTELGYTALMCALHERNDMAASLLLEKGAHVNIVTRDLQTPLSLIRSNGEMMITELLSRGLDPALSCRDQRILHTMVAEGKDSVVRGLVMNGFPPVDINVSRTGFGWYITDGSQTTTMSPLALALTYMHYNIARYLIVNHFFTRYDSVHLYWNQELRQSLQLQIQQPRESSRFPSATKCLGILDLLSARPLSLRDLCLVTISSALSQYLVRDPKDIPPGDSRWMCQPTFKKRVELLAIPPALKRELLHETSYSCIPCESWGDISLEGEM